eukprot:357237-Chlamydomonas_euryale.AAC.3
MGAGNVNGGASQTLREGPALVQQQQSRGDADNPDFNQPRSLGPRNGQFPPGSGTKENTATHYDTHSSEYEQLRETGVQLRCSSQKHADVGYEQLRETGGGRTVERGASPQVTRMSCRWHRRCTCSTPAR